AIFCDQHGPIDTLRLGEIDLPTPAPGEVQVALRAAGVNFPDGLLVQGLYQAKPELPFIPGMEFCGEISALGDGVTQLHVGQRVMGSSARFGAFAESLCVDARTVVPVPDAIPDAEAANLLCAHGTAHHALKQRAALQAGETVLVLGAAGGTGLAAVQIAKAMGATVIAAASTADKLALARDNGADHTLNYSTEDLKTTVRELTGGRGVDVVYDPVGGDAFDTSCRVMARGGRLLVIGFASGRIPKFPVNLALVKEFSVVGAFWGSFVRREPALATENFKELIGWYLAGTVKVSVEKTFPLEQTVAALDHVMGRKVLGKVAITLTD
ncbi:MAG: NADPH:quinone oxidoreductase family protein, partial [Pseudomonadota bacterium]